MQAVLGQGTQWLQSSESEGLQVCEEQLVVTVWEQACGLRALLVLSYP